jgi:LysR family transcriptional regulator, chromosome initiation inhibitor
MSLLSPPLQAFLAVAKHQTVHAAADAIHLTQTGVTQRIRSIEKRLKVTLFIRTRKGMRLTPEGEALLHYCQAAQNLEGSTLAKIKGHAEDFALQVALSGPSSVTRSRIIPACLQVAKKFPQLLFSFDINDNEERHKSLHKGLCDFAVLQPEHLAKEMAYKKLAPEKYVLVSTSRWKSRKLRDILSKERMVDFNTQDQMTLNYLKHHDLYEGLNPERHFVNRTDSLAIMIAEGLGYGVLTTEFAKVYVENGSLIILNQGKVYENPLVLAWFPRPEPSLYFSAIVKQIH